MDYGFEGLRATQAALQDEGHYGVGAGRDLFAARTPLIISHDDRRVGIIACCESQFGLAKRDTPGVAGIGPWIFGSISAIKRDVDFVVVSIHAAVEDSPWPSPAIQEFYRSLISAGASIVHGHHSHIPQGVENFEGGIILYGLGNFAVNPSEWRTIPNALWSIGAEVEFTSQPVLRRLVSFSISESADDEIRVVETPATNSSLQTKYLEDANKPLSDPELLEALWQEVSLRVFYHYGAEYMGFANNTRCSILKTFRNLLREWFRGKRYSRYQLSLWHLMFSCESHRSCLATALGVLCGEFADLRTDETRKLADEMMPWSIGIVPP